MLPIGRMATFNFILRHNTELPAILHGAALAIASRTFALIATVF